MQKQKLFAGSKYPMLRLRLAASVLFLALISAACDGFTPTINPVDNSNDELAPELRVYYSQMDGFDLLGPVISPPVQDGRLLYQYTQNVLLKFDPDELSGLRVSFAPLGLDMGISEPPVPQPTVGSAYYVEGHVIGAPFVDKYRDLGGLRHLGPPLTEMHFNPEYRRLEQFFSNVGMYVLEDDPERQVHLLAYGAWKCDHYCRQYASVTQNNTVTPYRVDLAFLDAVSRLGRDFTGAVLSDSYWTPDGYLEQVFANIVLVADPNQPSRVFLRPITEYVGILAEPIVPNNNDPAYAFYPVQDGLGYNVPLYLWEYMALHGGREASGPPIGELRLIQANHLRQCFTNLCLDVIDRPGEGQVIQPMLLGWIYYKHPLQPVNSITPTPPPQVEPPAAQPEIQPEQPAVETVIVEPAPVGPAPVSEPTPALLEVPAIQPVIQDASQTEIILQVWESFALLPANQRQEIGVIVLENGQPVAGLEPDLVLELPDGRSQRYYMYPTGPNGQSVYTLDEIDAPDGATIPYQVCVFYPGGQTFCVKGSFLIWQTP